MTMTFRLDYVTLATLNEFVLVANDRCGDCSPTLRLTASRSVIGSTWDIAFWVRTTGVRPTSVSVSVPGVIQAAPNSVAMSRVEVRVEGSQVKLTVMTPSRPIVSNTATLPPYTRVQYNDCGLSLAQGRLVGNQQLVAMQGDIQEFKFYECSNFTTLA